MVRWIGRPRYVRRLGALCVVLIASVAALIVVLVACASHSAALTAASIKGAPFGPAVEAEADLALTMKLHTGDAIAGGDLITYVLEVANQGPDDAEQVLLLESLSSALSHERIDGAGWICEETTSTLFCELGRLASGQVSTLTAVVRGPEEPITVWIAAQVSAGTPDPDRSDNQQLVFVPLAEPGADLWLSKRSSADPVTPNGVFSYVVTVQNSGPDDAQAAVVTDTLPPGMELRGVEASQGSCRDTVCSLGPLPAFGRAVITLSVVAPANEGVYTNTVQVGSETPDQYLGNNQAHEAVRVRRSTIYLPAIFRLLSPVTGSGH